MRVLQTGLSKKVVALAASVALGAGSIVALAPTASAAPGDTTFFPTGANAVDIVEDASGTLWVTNTGAGSISKVALDGTTVTFGVPHPAPFLMAAGPSGNIWFTGSLPDQIGRISPQGVVEMFGSGLPSTPIDIAQGPDGNMWFTLLAGPQVGKITPTGDVTLYDTGSENYPWITPGPQGSNRMYLASFGSNFLGYITMDGQFTEIPGPQGAIGAKQITLVNDQIWFLSEKIQGNFALDILTRLVADASFTQVSNPALQAAEVIGTGLDGTMWVSSGNVINHVTTAGAVVATYDIGVEARSLLQASDGNVWATTNDGITRVLTGVVPTSTAAPVLEPTSGLTAGAVVTATNGSWKYVPTSYAYQWQVCATSDAASCVDATGSTGQSYTVATTDVGKYLRVGVRASNLNGPSEPAYSGVVAAGEATPPPPPPPNPNPQPAAGDTAVIGNSVTMTLDAPARQKRGRKKWYEVDFSASDVQGAVVFEFSKGKRTRTKTVTIEDGIAEYRWKTPRKWRKGRTSVTATFIPAAGSAYTAAEVKDRVRIR